MKLKIIVLLIAVFTVLISPLVMSQDFYIQSVAVVGEVSVQNDYFLTNPYYTSYLIFSVYPDVNGTWFNCSFYKDGNLQGQKNYTIPDDAFEEGDPFDSDHNAYSTLEYKIYDFGTYNLNVTCQGENGTIDSKAKNTTLSKLWYETGDVPLSIFQLIVKTIITISAFIGVIVVGWLFVFFRKQLFGR